MRHTRPRTSNQALPSIPLANDRPLCACTDLQKLKAGITDFHAQYNVIVNLDRPEYEEERGKDVTIEVQEFERLYLMPMYQHLRLCADVVNFETLRSTDGSGESQIRFHLGNNASQGVVLGKRLEKLENEKKIPSAIPGGRLERVKAAAECLQSMGMRRGIVYPAICVHDAFECESDVSQNRPASTGVETRCERIDDCLSCSTYVPVEVRDKRSLYESVMTKRYPTAVLRVWPGEDPLGDIVSRSSNEAMTQLLERPCLQATIRTNTGGYVLESSSVPGIPDASFIRPEEDDNGSFRAFAKGVPGSLIKTMKRELSRNIESFEASGMSSAPTVSALTDIQSRFEDFAPGSLSNA